LKNLSDSNVLHLLTMLSEEAIFGILVFDLSNEKCIFANRLAKDLIEFPLTEDLSSLDINTIFPEKVRPEFRAISSELLKNEGLFQDVAIRKQNEMTFIANLGIKTIQFDDISCVTLMFQDITVQKKLQRDITAKQIEIKAAFEELLKQNQQLKELDLAKNRFIALTTHELRTPLSAMVASAEILKLGLYDNDEQRTEFTDIIYDQGQNLIALVNDILDFAKMQAGKTELFIEQSDLVKFVASQTESFVNMGETSNISINFDPRGIDQCLCYYDEMRLRQVFSNIITNAIKYNREGGKVKIWLEQDSNTARLFVEDTGKGIAPEDHNKVFNEFETLGKLALHHKGTGLGMPITKRIMEALGGKIELKSQLEVGTVFWITIPKEKILSPEVYRTRPVSASDLAA
jgi:signal transduction histidine kinase